MKIAKPTLIEERGFPFECSDSYGVDQDFQKLHWHQEMEICYIKAGCGKYLINGITYNFSEGDIFIISNDDIHLCYDDKNMIMQVIMFAPSFIKSDSASLLDFNHCSVFLKKSKQIKKGSPYHSKLTKILTEIEEEYINQQSEFQMMIKALLLEFISLSIRTFSEFSNSASGYALSSNSIDTIRKVIYDIEENFASDFSLEQISKKYHISVPYLSSCFKKLTGLSPINYLIRKRIAEAKHLLSSSDKSVLEISLECGFQSLSNFNHLFKDLVGYTPTDYRKNKSYSEKY